ncbi:hypothetical protein ZYGR_0AG04620 [Zygosaccharomyces rouxii]|uniref:CENP-Q homolog n=1 Tax=Zygosaccharomyces rouxii TaxID=4956 RepID=A0A1Q3AA10_ZYGRO|nr:hypothetical protein ZYGR_0AG04620 [Zygosaccharomyces rouxii]
MSKRILDQIEANSDNSSVEDVDTEALRLDKIPSPKKLFYEDEDEDQDEDEDEDQDQGHNGEDADNETVSQQEYEPIDEPINVKRVRFKRRQRDPVSDAEAPNVRYWDFGPLIRQGFRDKLPSNYEIKRWKRPSKHMVRSVVQLLEANFETAIEQVFDRYNDELGSAVNDSTAAHRQKHILMNDLVLKIRHQLKKSKFPSRISDRDIDIEYIVAKRKYIQSRYAQELANAEKLEDELIREEQKLREAKELCQDLQTSNKRKLQERLLKNDLHPSLTKAMENAYGLIPDSSQLNQGNNIYTKDAQELQLASSAGTTINVLEDEDTSDIEKLVPALHDYHKISQSIYNNIDKFMKLNQVESVLDKIDKSSRDNE